MVQVNDTSFPPIVGERSSQGGAATWLGPAVEEFDPSVGLGQSISLLRDRRTVLVASGSNRLRFWEASTGKPSQGDVFPSAVCVFNRAPNALKGVITECLGPAGGQMSATVRVPHLVERAVLMDLAAGEVVRTLGGWFRPPAGTILLSADGRHLVEITPKRTDQAEVEIVDVRTLRTVRRFSTKHPYPRLRAVKPDADAAPTPAHRREIFRALAPDNRQLAVWASSHLTFLEWDVRTGKKVSETSLQLSESDRPVNFLGTQ